MYTLNGTTISQLTKLQKVVTLPTTELEYMATTKDSKEMIWLKFFLEELDHKQGKSVLHCDSQSAIDLEKNPIFHARTKQIQVRYHFIKTILEDKILVFEKIQGNQNPTDMLGQRL